jgi:hypothetical protein
MAEGSCSPVAAREQRRRGREGGDTYPNHKRGVKGSYDVIGKTRK